MLSSISFSGILLWRNDGPAFSQRSSSHAHEAETGNLTWCEIFSRREHSQKRPSYCFCMPKKWVLQERGEVILERGPGFTNPYKHLKTCVSDGDEMHLSSLFERVSSENSQFAIIFRSRIVRKPNDKDCAMYKYLRLILVKSLPISTVPDPELRSFCKFGNTFSINFTKSVICFWLYLLRRESHTWCPRLKVELFMTARVAVEFTFMALLHLSWRMLTWYKMV